MESDILLVLIALSVVGAALVSAKSGVATAFLEILAGFILGAFFYHELPASIETLSELGLIALMFLAGLEVDFSFIRNKGRQGIKLGIYTFLASFVLIGSVGWFVFELTLPQVLILATALSESSAGIVYPVLRQKGRLGSRRKIILAAVMVMEFMGIAIISTVFAKVTWYSVFVIVFIFAIWKLYPYVRKKLRRVAKATSENLALKFILAILLVSSFLGHSTGIDAVLIVFILGMLLAKYIGDHPTLRREIETISFGFLTPLFFFSVGFNLSASQVFAQLPQIIILTILAFSITFVIAYFPAKKYLPKRARQIGFLLNAPMSVGIIAVTIGLEREILTQELYIIILGAVLLSSFIAVVFTRYPQQGIPSAIK